MRYKNSYSESRHKVRKEMGQRGYTAAYRSDAVKLAKEFGASAAAQQLKIPEDALYTWISRAKKGFLPTQRAKIRIGPLMNLAY